MNGPKNPERRGFVKALGVAAGGALVQTSSAVETAGARMRSLVSRSEPLMCPGGYDVLSARLIELHGFEAMVVGGSACSASMYGVPDYGLVSITELIELTARIAGAVDIPVLADADDGGGSPLNVYRAMQGFERAGIAAVMIEDHVQVKHVGGEGELVPTSAMADKVKAAVDARRGDTIVLARGDSVSVGESAEAAIERGVAYAEAGADMLFFAGMSLEDCPRAAEAVQKPLMTTVRDTPLDVLKHQKIALAVYAAHALQLALGAADRGLAELKRSARIEGFRENAIDGETYSKLLRSDEERTRARTYHLT